MKFLVDQQLPKKLAGWIRERGCEAHHLKEIGMLHAEDADIWRAAEARGAVIISKDEDFSVIVRIQPGPQVVWLRVGNCSNDALLARMADVWPTLILELEAGVRRVEVR